MKIPAFMVVAGGFCLATAITLGAGCAKPTTAPATQPSGTSPDKTDTTGPSLIQTTKPTKIANPASVKCSDEKLGYRTGEDATGQYGVCIFDDKSECEEWAYFRGECEKGDCKKWEGCPKMKPGGK